MIFISRLSHGKLFIGDARKIRNKWTRRYKFIEIDHVVFGCDNVDRLTLIYMSRYGIENVRGGRFVKMKLPHFAEKLILREIGACERCFEFGRCNCQRRVIYDNPVPYLKPTVSTPRFSLY